MNKKIKIVALDLDGTLTNTQKQVTPVTKEAIDKAREMGVAIVLASGRPHIGIKTVADALDVAHKGGYILSYNGGRITDCLTNEIIYERTIKPEYYQDICDTIRRFENITPLTYDATSVIAENPDAKYVHTEAYNCSLPIRGVESLYEEVKNEPIVKFEIVGEHEDLEPVREYLQGKYGDELSVYYSMPYFLEVMAPNIAKDTSLAVLLEKLGLTRDELMACGDGLNDLPMLKYAGLSVVMENGYDEVKAVADYVTSSNDEDGVAKAFDKFIFN